MKLIIAITHERDKHKLADALLQEGLSFTKLGSTGGFKLQIEDLRAAGPEAAASSGAGSLGYSWG